MNSNPNKYLIKKVRENVISKYGNIFLDLDNAKRRPEQEKIIRGEVRLLLGEDNLDLEDILVDHLVGLGRIAPLLKDLLINEIMINGKEVWIEKKGRLIKTDIVFDDLKEVEHLLQRIVQMDGRKIDWSNPLVDAKLPDGSRVNAVIKPSAVAPYITIRKFGVHCFTSEELIQQSYLSEEMAIFLAHAVKGKLNILICGAAGSTKTTLLRTLGSLVPPNERLITVEDVRELNISHPHIISLEATPKASVYDLMVNALRMRPDRIFVGECRGMETFELLQAMGTGHNGSITTTHCNNNKIDAFQRLIRAMIRSGMSDRELMAQIASVIDLTVFIKKFKDGIFRITNMAEVTNKENGPKFRDIFTFDSGRHKHKAVQSLTSDRIQRIKETMEIDTLPEILAFSNVAQAAVGGVGA